MFQLLMFGNGANASFWKFLSQEDISPLEIRVEFVPPWNLLHNIEACVAVDFVDCALK